MAANSIAKLAIVLTGDTAPLARDLNRGSALVTQFTGKVNTQTSAMFQAGQAAKGWGAALGVAGGNLGKLSALASFGPQAGLVVAAAVTGKLAFNLAAVSDALKVASGASTMETWAGQWDRVQLAATSIAQSLGRPVSELLTREAQHLADIMSWIAEKIMPEQVRLEREKLALMEKQAAEAEKRAKVDEQVAAEWKKFWDAVGEAEREQGVRLNARGVSLRESLRTPMEQFKDDLQELDILFSGGHISLQTLQRASDKATADLLGANKKVQEFKSQVAGPVGAAERFTSAGQSAVAAAQRAAQQQIEVEKAQLAEEKTQTKHLAELERMSRTNKGVTLTTSNLQ